MAYYIKYTGFLCLLFSSKLLLGQFSVVGKIFDAKQKQIEFVTVKLLRDTLVINTVSSDSAGSYRFEGVPRGQYRLIFSRIGYQQYDSTFTFENDAYITATLYEDKRQIQGVTVIAKKPLIERKIDRLVFNVENSVMAAGGDALDALKVTPGVIVSNNFISMIGKGGMRVMIDDRIIPLSGDDLLIFLKTIKSDDIKSIEVISNPPAKYDAQGNSGLINIKLKKIKKDAWSATLRSTYTQATYAAGSLGASVAFQKNKLSLFASGGNTQGSTAPVYETSFFYPTQIWVDKNTNRDRYNNTGIRVGMDYKLTPKLSLGVQYLGNFNKKNTNETNKSVIGNKITGFTDSLINNIAKDRQQTNTHSFNFHVSSDIDSIGRKIALDFNYFSLTNSNSRNFTTKNYSADQASLLASFAANNIGQFDLENFSGGVDLEWPTKWINISAGGKFSASKNSSNTDYFETTTGLPIPNPLLSNAFVYRERIGAAYLSGNKKLNKSWEIQTGLRVEATQTKGISLTNNTTTKNSYVRFFPTAYISYTSPKDNVLQLNYGRRIERPNFENLNPFRIYNNRYQYMEGNPLLQPYYSHNLELSYIVKQNWVHTLYFTSVTDGIAGLVIIDPNTNIQANIMANYFAANTWGLSESYSINIANWLESANTFTLFYSKISSSNQFTEPTKSGLNSVISTTNNIVVNKARTFSFNINYAYTFKGVDNIYSNAAYSQLDIGLRLLLLKKQMQIGIVGNDILKSSIVKQTAFINKLQTNYKNYYDTRFFRISISYKIGSKILKVAQHAPRNKDEVKRANKK
jgi:Outer membrane protein beta-barrel family/CarboxypepD_reg-like domain